MVVIVVMLRNGASAHALLRPGSALAAFLVIGVLWSPAAAVTATLVGPLAYGYPQIRDALTAPSVDGLAPTTYAVSAAENLFWFLYAVSVTDFPLALYNSVGATVNIVTVVIWHVRSRRARMAAEVSLP